MTVKHILLLLKKEAIIESRNAHTFASIILFTLTTVFLVNKSFNQLAGMQWNGLVWIILLFASTNSIFKSFTPEASKTKLYYYTIYHPLEVIISKLIYNYIFSLFIFGLTYVAFTFFFGNPIKDFTLFWTASLVGIFGISTVFTFVAAITASSDNGSVLIMSVLSLPLTLPFLLILIKTTAVAMRLIQDSSVGDDINTLIGLDLLFLGIVLILFNELWKS